MELKRTKRLTESRVLKILQLRYGSQVQKVSKQNGKYIADSILNEQPMFSRDTILKIEDDIYSSFRC